MCRVPLLTALPANGAATSKSKKKRALISFLLDSRDLPRKLHPLQGASDPAGDAKLRGADEAVRQQPASLEPHHPDRGPSQRVLEDIHFGSILADQQNR